MIEINKLSEPSELVAYRKQKFSSYDGMDKTVRAALLDRLLEEQGYLCAYCMRRLQRETATIEHWKPQSIHPALSMDYKNMLAVCPGNRGNRDLTCDASKGDHSITVNPLLPNTLQSIYYKSNGEIHAKEIYAENDLIFTLNLNCQSVLLPSNRKKALEGLIRVIQRKYPTGKIPCDRLLKHYQSEEIKEEYLGILLWWLKKHT